MSVLFSSNLVKLFQAQSFGAIYPTLSPEDKVAASHFFQSEPTAQPIDDGVLLPGTSERKRLPDTFLLTGPTENESPLVDKKSGYRNLIDAETGQPELAENFAERLAKTSHLTEIHLQFLPGGRVTALSGDNKTDHFGDHNIKLTRLDEGIYNVYVWNSLAKTPRWEMLDGQVLEAEDGNVDGTPHTDLLQRVFVKEERSFLNSSIDFLQMSSVITLALRTADYIKACKQTLEIKRQLNERLRDDNFTAAMATLIEASASDMYFDDGSPEIELVKAAGDVANRLFLDFVSGLKADRLQGKSLSHLERILRSYAASYVWNEIGIENLITATIDLPYLERLNHITKAIINAKILPFSDHKTLERILEIADRHKDEEKLSSESLTELETIFRIHEKWGLDN